MTRTTNSSDFNHNISKKRLEIAEKFYLKSLKIEEEILDQEGIANTYGQMGNIRLLQCKKTETREFFNKCYQINEKLNNKFGINLAKKC